MVQIDQRRRMKMLLSRRLQLRLMFRKFMTVMTLARLIRSRNQHLQL
jgi:hypothetical protein